MHVEEVVKRYIWSKEMCREDERYKLEQHVGWEHKDPENAVQRNKIERIVKKSSVKQLK